MEEILIGLLNVLVSFYTAHLIDIYPLWNTLGWKKRGVVIYACCMTFFISACYLIAVFAFALDAQGLQMFKLYITIPKLILLFCLFRKRVWQLIFLIALAFLYGPISTGIGVFAADTWFNSTDTLLTESLITLVVAVFTLPPLLLILKRLCNNPQMKQAIIFWRFIWLLPGSFFAVTMMTSSYLNEKEKGIEFIIIRIVLYCAMLLICYLLEKTVTQISEARLTAEIARQTTEAIKKDLETQKQLAAGIPPGSLIVCWPFTLNTAKRQAFVKDIDLALKDKEFNLLAYFIERENETITPEEIYWAVWNQPHVSTDNALRGNLYRLRKKIKGSGYIISNVRGMGYLLEKE